MEIRLWTTEEQRKDVTFVLNCSWFLDKLNTMISRPVHFFVNEWKWTSPLHIFIMEAGRQVCRTTEFVLFIIHHSLPASSSSMIFISHSRICTLHSTAFLPPVQWTMSWQQSCVVNHSSELVL
jgi:hypothetical protein